MGAGREGGREGGERKGDGGRMEGEGKKRKTEHMQEREGERVGGRRSKWLTVSSSPAVSLQSAWQPQGP